MPLPANGTAWPPKDLATITTTLAEWSAWFEGTAAALTKAYLNVATTTTTKRSWWGRTTTSTSTAERPDQLHVPIAADLCRASADLLYAEPPTFKIDGNEEAQARLDDLREDAHQVLASGAEVGAALGGRFHRVTWDRALEPDGAFLTTVDADSAAPEFRWGRLVAVTFWHVLPSPAGSVIRHLERHELDRDGNGLILHGLYDGTANDLGHAVPLADHPATAGLATAVDETGAIIEGRTPGLCVVYVPNQTPQRRWRKDPVGRNLGRSDLDGVEPLMDALDEAYGSLMRDVRLGKGRIIVPAFMLQDNGPGKGASFDLDREVYDSLNIPMPEDGTPPIVAQQFQIRVTEHLELITDLIGRILTTSGYSAQTFGAGPDGAAITATEVQARERRSFLTRARKARIEERAVSRLLTKLLSIDQALFNGPALVDGQRIAVEFGDSVQDSLLTLAQTAQAMANARAASIAERVRTLHPDWTDEQVEKEVDAISQEDAVADPFAPPPGAE
ncbi:A118 family predicted phage portal protein [Sediminihabitans luteus]|uniref:A118 family predicted phage portal protein n=1 Tax=Sediminihabitans luteus TaxID=1138585 RepID=A0A2M9D056_9CELL|nr:phage portal protein [Sediminihabitans luteus]PJJ77483.1 A118 family predicted phage portal protein [Sediminihabitans luteus]GII98379.1 hypothetical protein Slu03_07570 [Sediminihabitans luteus]